MRLVPDHVSQGLYGHGGASVVFKHPSRALNKGRRRMRRRRRRRRRRRKRRRKDEEERGTKGE